MLDSSIFVLCQTCPKAMETWGVEEHLDEPGRHDLLEIDLFSGTSSPIKRDTTKMGRRDKRRNPNVI